MPKSRKMQLAKSLHWLPPGWIVEFKERPSGARAKIYIDPVSGHKFRSKPEVLRYLRLPVPAPKETEGSSNVPGVVEFTNNKRTVIRLVQDGSLEKSLEWLPLNWQVELKERKSGRVDRYFIDPVSGFKFWSKNEVSRYIQSGEKPKRSRYAAGRVFNNTRTVTRLVQDGSLDASFDWLPSNWQVELKKRNTGRVDRYYIDPVTGFRFWSKHGVLDYLQNGEKADDAGRKYRIPSAAKLRMLARSGTGRGMLTGWRSNTSRAAKNKRVIKLSDAFASKQCWKGKEAYNVKELAIHLANIRDSGNRHTDLVSASKGCIVALSADSTQKRKDHNGVGRASNKKPKHSPQETENESVYRVPCRTSRRLAGLDPELPSGMGKGKQIVLIEPTHEADIENDMYSLGGDEHPNEFGKQYYVGDAAADCKMELVLVESKFKVALPRVDGDTEKYVLSLGGGENPNELGEAYEEYTADHTMKSVFDEPESEVAPAMAEGVSEKYVPSFEGEEHLNELGKTREEGDAAVDYAINLLSEEPDSRVRLHDTEKDVPSLGGEEQPNELRQTYLVRNSAAEYTMDIVPAGDPESKVTLPRAEGDTENFVPSLGGDERPNELGETDEGGDAAADDTLKLVSDETQTEKYVPSLLGEEKQNVLGKAYEERDAAAEYTVNVVSEDPESKVTLPKTEDEMPKTEDDTDKDVPCFDGEEKLNELGKSYHEEDDAADYRMELVSEEPESEVALTRAEGVTDKYMPSFDGEEQLNELGKAYEKGDAAADHMINVVSEEPESKVTLPRTEGDTDKDVPCFDSEEEANGLGKTQHDGDATADYTMGMGLASEETESEVPLARDEGVTDKYMPFFYGEEQLNDLGKAYEKGDAAADHMINVVSEEPESKVTLPRPEGDTDMDVPYLDGEEQPNELGKTFHEGKATAEEPESEVAPARAEGVTEKYMRCFNGEEQLNELGKEYKEGDTVADYTINIVSKEPESKITLPRTEGDTEKDVPPLGVEERIGNTCHKGYAAADCIVKLASEDQDSIITLPMTEGDTEQDVHSLGGKERLNELGKTCHEGDAAEDLSPASEEQDSIVTQPRAEGGTEKDIPFLGGEQPDELGKTSKDIDAPVDCQVKLASKGLETKTTLPGIKVDIEKEMGSFDGTEQPNELRKMSENKVSSGDFQMKLKTTVDEDAPGDDPMKLALKEPKSKTKLPRVEDTENDIHFLGDEEKLKEPSGTPEVIDTPADYKMQLKATENKDAPGDYPVKLAYKETESDTAMARVEVGRETGMHCLRTEEKLNDCLCTEEKLNEHGETSDSRVAPTDYGMNYAVHVPQSGFTLPFGELRLEFAYKRLTGMIPLENLTVKHHKHVTSASTQNTGFLKWQDFHGMANPWRGGGPV